MGLEGGEGRRKNQVYKLYILHRIETETDIQRKEAHRHFSMCNCTIDRNSQHFSLGTGSSWLQRTVQSRDCGIHREVSELSRMIKNKPGTNPTPMWVCAYFRLVVWLRMLP